MLEWSKVSGANGNAKSNDQLLVGQMASAQPETKVSDREVIFNL